MRHLLNLFRRMFQIGLLPYRLKDERGRPYSKKFTFLAYLVAKLVKRPQTAPAEDGVVLEGHQVEGTFIHDFVHAMKKGLSDPNSLVSELAILMTARETSGERHFENGEVEEIQSA